MNDLLNSLLGSTQAGGWLFPAIIGLSIALVAFSVFAISSARSSPLRRRIESLSDERGKSKKGGVADKLGNSLRPLGSVLIPRREEEKETLRKQMVHAGFNSDTAVATMYGAKILLLIGLPALVGGYLLLNTDASKVVTLFATLFAALAGLLGPSIYLERRIANRQYEMMKAFPDALDLLVTCTEAGLGLNAALQRVGKQMSISSPLLASELETVNAEIRGGVDRMVALRHLVDRTGLDDIRGLVSLLSQSVRFGTSIAGVLRVYSEEFRDKRMQKIEEQAAMIGTKLIFPLVTCIFPAFFIVVVGPAVIGIVRAFTGAGMA